MMQRFVNHILMTSWHQSRAFPPSTLQAIEAAVTDAEKKHGGELRFVVERELSTAELFGNVSPRQRALELFGQLGVWDTAGNNGVLIYVLLADHDVEIVADRGYNGKVSNEEWAAVCHDIETAFKTGRYEQGALAGIAAASKLMARCYPTPDANEMTNAPTLL